MEREKAGNEEKGCFHLIQILDDKFWAGQENCHSNKRQVHHRTLFENDGYLSRSDRRLGDLIEHQRTEL